MNAYRLPNGNLLVPYAFYEDGIMGDGMIEVPPGDPEYEKWVKVYENRGKEIPPARHPRKSH